MRSFYQRFNYEVIAGKNENKTVNCCIKYRAAISGIQVWQITVAYLKNINGQKSRYQLLSMQLFWPTIFSLFLATVIPQLFHLTMVNYRGKKKAEKKCTNTQINIYVKIHTHKLNYASFSFCNLKSFLFSNCAVKRRQQNF